MAAALRFAAVAVLWVCLPLSPGSATTITAPFGPSITITPFTPSPRPAPPPYVPGPSPSAPVYTPPPVYQPSPAELQQQRATAINQQAIEVENRGNHAAALRLFEQALALCTNANAALIIRHNIGNTYSWLAREAQDQGNNSLALRYIELAMQYYPDQRQLDWPGWAERLREQIREQREAVEEENQRRVAVVTQAESIRAAARAQIQSGRLADVEAQRAEAKKRIAEQLSALNPAQQGAASTGNTKFFGTPVGPGREAVSPSVPTGAQTKYSSTGEQLHAAAVSAEAAACVFEGQAGCPTGQRFDPIKLSSNSTAFQAMAAKVATKPELVRDGAFMNSFNWYRHLDGQVMETKSELEAVQRQLDSNQGDRPVLEAQKGTLENTIKHNETDKAMAKQWMDERAKTFKITLDWPEETPANATPPQKPSDQAPAKADAPATVAH
ncbi:MAG: hypothetical protein ACLP1D_27700 [Xanthobacteraceae bacterium]